MPPSSTSSEYQQKQPGLVPAWLTPRRTALGLLAIAAIVLSPALVVYEFVLGVALVGAGYALRLSRRGGAEDPMRAVGFALLAGPAAYAAVALVAAFFNW